MVNLLVILQKIYFFFYYMIDLLRLFQNRSFVLSSGHENQNIATIGTLLDQFMLTLDEKMDLLMFANGANVLQIWSTKFELNLHWRSKWLQTCTIA